MAGHTHHPTASAPAGGRGPAARAYGWFDDRFHITPLIDFMRHKRVPVRKHTIWYYMGGVALFLFMVQVVVFLRRQVVGAPRLRMDRYDRLHRSYILGSKREVFEVRFF